ncbi:hypothetical protein K488DRAFT_23276, partial [Vararia minispora EC-137]
AQEHAANADDNASRGLLIPASDEHAKAAAAYQECVDASNDEGAKTTLRRLHNHHSKMAADFQTRIAQLRKDGVDPALPQKPAQPRHSSTPHHVAPNPSASLSPHASRTRIGDSQLTVDESFMLLGPQSTSADAGDAFSHFWRAMERLDHLAKPVAFATASLGLGSNLEFGRRSTHSSDTEDSDRPRKGSMKQTLSPDNSFSTAYDGETAKSHGAKQPVIDLRGDFDEIAEEDYDSSDSFCFVPSKSEPSPAVLRKENDALRVQAENLQKQLDSAQRLLQQRSEQDQQLRDSIAIARREAHRAMGASFVLHRPGPQQFDLNALGSLSIPPAPVARGPPPPSRDQEAQQAQARRIRELEEELRVTREEVRTVRVENEKQKAMIAKFRERWDKLKESAKRKREAKAAAEAQGAPVHERIDEEPEAEAQAE